MWNKIRTDEYESMLAETVSIKGYKGDSIHAYFSRPLGKGPVCRTGSDRGRALV
jgi:carboxymethylenebutenolidase